MSTIPQHLTTIRILFDEAERRGILLWLESGWAIDARLGRITREHGDIDIAFPENQEQEYRELIESLGFDRHESMEYGFLSWRGSVLLDSEPCFGIDGEYGFENFPAGSCPIEKQGVIDGYEVRCLSWAAIYFEFLGYMDEVPREQWRSVDFESLRLIESRLAADEREQLREWYVESTQRDNHASIAHPMNEHCPTCNSPLHRFRSGGSLAIRCSSPSCSWTVATTFPVPILRDHTVYSLIIPALPDATPAVLIALNQRFTHGIVLTRSLAIRGELPVFVGDALDVWHEAQRLRGAGVPFLIEPSYPFDLDAPETAFGPPDGRFLDESEDA